MNKIVCPNCNSPVYFENILELFNGDVRCAACLVSFKIDQQPHEELIEEFVKLKNLKRP
ncbi:hypothetical protein [Bacillus ndiopicus]|uniref:hypothetical protein n=1 Tax=Bacillus ndiopicus TaxID=1347368 RepID=UPI0012B63A4F|nr:hypothetical protein [Bacillus ndiopicus]